MSRQITIPTKVTFDDLVAQGLSEDEAKKILENLWLAMHPGAANALRNPLSREQLADAEDFVRGKKQQKGHYATTLAVFQKAFLVDERFAAQALSFIEEERSNLNGGMPEVAVGHAIPSKRKIQIGEKDKMGRVWTQKREDAMIRAHTARHKNGVTNGE